MPEVRTTSKVAIKRFWDRFVDRARGNGVKGAALRWHVLRAEAYLKAFPDKRLSEHSAEDVTGYLEGVGRKEGIADWQFVQIVDAIQNLLQTAGVAVADEVDWMYWRDSARALAAGHPTIAREGGSAGDAPVSGARFKEKRNPPSALDAVREDHAPLLERLAAEVRRRKYSIRTEQAYESWIGRFILFCGNEDPRVVGEDRIVAFLEDLAVREQVSASTQHQALNALVFLFKQVLKRELGQLGDFARPKRPKRLPVVLERVEVVQLLEQLEGTQHMMAALLYGTGMRLMECVRLRVQDVDFHYHQIVVRDGKGQKDRAFSRAASHRASVPNCANKSDNDSPG